MTVTGVALTGVQKKTITDKVQLPRFTSWLYAAVSRPRRRGDGRGADVLAGGKNSRLYKASRLRLQIAQDVNARPGLRRRRRRSS